MSVRVNLLPKESADRQRASKARAGAAAGGVVLVAALAGVYLWKLGQVSDAEATLAAEQAEAQGLQAEIAELNEFAEIQASLVDADDNVAAILGGEIGVAGILQDVAVVMPTDTEISELSITATPDDELVTVGAMTMVGRTTNRHAPGLERLLLELDKVAAFQAPYFGAAAVDNDEAVAFDVSVQLGSEVFTDRYEDGIPEVLR